jgi:hypothetical protein
LGIGVKALPSFRRNDQAGTKGDPRRWISGTGFGSHKEDFAGVLVQSADFGFQVFSIKNAVPSWPNLPRQDSIATI